MNLWMRLAYLMLTWRFKSESNWQEVGRKTFRVWPTDLDVFNHMNNGVYLSLLDLGRIDLSLRSGVWQQWKKAGWYPVVVAENITFRKSLRPWQKFDLETKVIGWDEQAFYFEQRFTVAGEIFTTAIVRLRFLKKTRGILTTQEVLDAGGGWRGPVPMLPTWVREWAENSALPKGKEPAPSTWPS